MNLLDEFSFARLPGARPQRSRLTRPALRTTLTTSSLLIGFLASGAMLANGAPNQASPRSLVNMPAPEIARKDLNGAHISLKGLRGKVVLLNFWATWCAPCQIEMPVFAQWQQRYGSDGLQVIGISMDDDAAPARRLVSKLNLNYPVVMGDAVLGKRYGGVLGLPLTFLIDRSGVIRAQFQGEADLGKIEKQLIDKLSAR